MKATREAPRIRPRKALQPAAQRAVVLTSAILAAAVLLSAIALVIRGFDPLPYWDHWLYAYSLEGARIQFPVWFFSPHNEHQILFPKLFLLADYYWFGGRNVFLTTCIFLAQAGSLFALWRLAKSTGMPPMQERFCLFAAAILLFSPAQIGNFGWPFQITFVLVHLAAVACFAVLARFAPSRGNMSWQALLAACFAAVVASFSLASGLFIWPFAMLIAWRLGAGRRGLALFAVAAAASAAVCFYWHVRASSHNSVAASLGNIPRLLGYAATVLGSPFYDLLRDTLATVSAAPSLPLLASTALGVAGLSGWLYFVWLTARSREGNPGKLALLGFAGFLVATAFITAAGRSMFPLDTAVASRYVTPAAMFWACLVVLELARRASPAQGICLRHAVVAGVAAASALAGYMNNVPVVQAQRLRSDRMAAALLAGVHDPEVWDRTSPYAYWVVWGLRHLRGEHKSVFAGEWGQTVGRPLRDLYPSVPAQPDPAACAGTVDATAATESTAMPGNSVQGSAWDRAAGAAPKAVLFADNDGRVAGLAFPAAGHSKPPAGWTGYVAGWRARQITPYAVLATGLCRLPAFLTAATPVDIPPERAGTPFDTARAAVEGQWLQDGAAPSIPRPGYVSGVSGTFGTDGTSTLRIGPFAVAGESVALPVLTGPAAENLSIEVLDDRSEQQIAFFDGPEARQWRLWRIDTLGLENIRIIVRDGGSDPAQWIAVGTPLRLTQSGGR